MQVIGLADSGSRMIRNYANPPRLRTHAVYKLAAGASAGAAAGAGAGVASSSHLVSSVPAGL